MTQTEFDSLPFSEKFRIASQRFSRRPLAFRLGVMVKAGLLTEEERQRTLKRVVGKKAKRPRSSRPS